MRAGATVGSRVDRATSRAGAGTRLCRPLPTLESRGKKNWCELLGPAVDSCFLLLCDQGQASDYMEQLHLSVVAKGRVAHGDGANRQTELLRSGSEWPAGMRRPLSIGSAASETRVRTWVVENRSLRYRSHWTGTTCNRAWSFDVVGRGVGRRGWLAASSCSLRPSGWPVALPMGGPTPISSHP